MPAAISPTRALDVLIAGAGPAGSATAFWLARAGYHVVLVDRCSFPRDKPCSEYLGPGAADRLDRIGVLDELWRRGAQPLTGTTVVTSRGSTLTGKFAQATSQRPDAVGLSVTRRVLDEVLLHRALEAGAGFLPGHAVEDLVTEAGMVRGVRLRDPAGSTRTLAARLVVGADGLRSVVARRMGGVRIARPRRMAFVAHIRGVGGLGSGAEMHVSAAGYAGLNPLSHGLANVAMVVPIRRAEGARGRVTEFFFETLETFPGVRGRIDRAGLTGEIAATGPFSTRARRVIAEGALLVGDAADFFDPFTGEGIYTALRGAELASDAAIQALQPAGPARAANLKGYPRARRRAFLGKWAVERLLGYGMLAPALFDRAVDRLGRRGSMAHTLIGVTADFVPARRVLNPLFLSRMVI